MPPCITSGAGPTQEREYDKALADLTEAIRLARNTRMPTMDEPMPTQQAQIRQGDRGLHGGHPAEPEVGRGIQKPGSVYDNKGDYDKAIADFSEAIRLRPEDAPPHYGQRVPTGKRGNTTRRLPASTRPFG